jgi:hypothetical protein
LSGIRREDAKNMATLRQTHLNQLSHGAGE